MRYTARLFPLTGEKGKQCVANDLETIRRWAGHSFTLNGVRAGTGARIVVTERKEEMVGVWELVADERGGVRFAIDTDDKAK